MMSSLLITGFEPFDGFSTNPSAELANTLDGKKIAGYTIKGTVLPLHYKTALGEFDNLLKSIKPSVILCCGQASRAAITIERLGINAINKDRADNYDNFPEVDIIKPSGPAAYFSNIDPHPLVTALTKEEIPASVSYHAGTYGCNWLLYSVMHRIETGEIDARATFIHVPALPAQAIEKKSVTIATMPLEMIVRAVEIIIEHLD
ncbi:MAG: pyroglutamyl-peptidase I family protein [Candidatus Thorarchaeota archaeon]